MPIEGGAIGSGRVTSTTTAYYGPGTNYKQHQQKISSGTTGAVMAWENGYVCLEFQPSGSYQIRRVWLPENVVSLNYYCDTAIIITIRTLKKAVQLHRLNRLLGYVFFPCLRPPVSSSP